MRRNLGARLGVGIDLGSYSVKLYAAGVRGLAGTPPAWAEAALPRGNGDPAGPAAAALAECMTRLRIAPGSVRTVATGIAGPDVIVKQVQLPLMDDEEVGPALRYEARKHLPFDPQGMVLDFQILGRYAVERKLDVLLAAVSQARLERHMAPLRKLDLEPDIVDATPLALANAALAAGEGGRVLLDIGQEASTLTIWQQGEPFFSRRIGFGGRSISRAIGEAGRIPLEEAEAWKVAAGGPRATHILDWSSPEMQGLVDSLRRDLAEELRRSFAFYQTQGRLPEPLTLHLCGGSAQLPSLGERVGELLGLPVEVFEPLVPPGSPRAGPQFAQAYGLALRTR